jgi:alpha/beta superfamily hydrolase
MRFIEKLDSPGEHSLLLKGLTGQLEAVLAVPDKVNTDYVAFLGHPHSLQGGTMNNKVVTTMARVFKELGVPSLRFNFRGVGQSEGIYNDGIGESEDMILLAKEWQKVHVNARFIFAGFSFGSYVAYRAAGQMEHALLITIAPPVHHYNYREYNPKPNPWLIVQGDADDVVPFEMVINFAKKFSPALPVIEFANTGHFFHGTLLELKAQLMKYIQTQVLLL